MDGTFTGRTVRVHFWTEETRNRRPVHNLPIDWQMNLDKGYFGEIQLGSPFPVSRSRRAVMSSSPSHNFVIPSPNSIPSEEEERPQSAQKPKPDTDSDDCDKNADASSLDDNELLLPANLGRNSELPDA